MLDLKKEQIGPLDVVEVENSKHKIDRHENPKVMFGS